MPVIMTANLSEIAIMVKINEVLAVIFKDSRSLLIIS
jgi:hypothetical protein